MSSFKSLILSAVVVSTVFAAEASIDQAHIDLAAEHPYACRVISYAASGKELAKGSGTLVKTEQGNKAVVTTAHFPLEAATFKIVFQDGTEFDAGSYTTHPDYVSYADGANLYMSAPFDVAVLQGDFADKAAASLPSYEAATTLEKRLSEKFSGLEEGQDAPPVIVTFVNGGGNIPVFGDDTNGYQGRYVSDPRFHGGQGDAMMDVDSLLLMYKHNGDMSSILAKAKADQHTAAINASLEANLVLSERRMRDLQVLEELFKGDDQQRAARQKAIDALYASYDEQFAAVQALYQETVDKIEAAVYEIPPFLNRAYMFSYAGTDTPLDSIAGPGSSGAGIFLDGQFFGVMTNGQNCTHSDLPDPRSKWTKWGSKIGLAQKVDFWPGYESYFNSTWGYHGWLVEVIDG